jgi:hypothetical protein
MSIFAFLIRRIDEDKKRTGTEPVTGPLPKLKRSLAMKFLSVYKNVERSTPPSQEEMANMGKLIQEGFQKGWLVATEGCLPSALGVRVRAEGNGFLVKDGPFTESKEVIGGFAILKAASKAEAVELTKRFMTISGHGGECELRQLFEMHDAPCTTAEAAAKA